ncbi:MAG: helix-turn-helix transcriptional regulator [Opitutaceae bacterium]|nr:helix-turn-helix transcriptional regulator [Opitutaceae bacterium]
MRASPPGIPLSPQVSDAVYCFPNLRPAGRQSCTVSAAGRERCNPDYLIRRRKYGFTVIECVAEGAGHVVLDGIKFPLGPGSVFAYKRDTACEIHTDPVRRLLKYFICLSGRDAAARLRQAGVAPGRAVQLSARADIESLFAQVIHEGQARTRHSSAICDALLLLTLLKIRQALARRSRRPPPGYERYLRVKRFIEAHAGRLRSLQDIARQTGVTPVAACKLFSQHLGLSPFRYLMQRKMELAAEHLLQEGALVKETAAHVGFADPYHFSRRFKHAHGVSPTRLRAQGRGATT